MSYLTEHGTTTDDVQDADDGNITYSASEVANDILENGFANFDYNAWPDLTVDEKAQAYDDLIASYASYEWDENLSRDGNKSSRDTETGERIFSRFKFWAQREINRLPRNGLVK